MSFLFGRKQLDGKRVVEGSVLLKNMRCELNFYLPTTPTYVQGMCAAEFCMLHCRTWHCAPTSILIPKTIDVIVRVLQLLENSRMLHARECD